MRRVLTLGSLLLAVSAMAQDVPPRAPDDTPAPGLADSFAGASAPQEDKDPAAKPWAGFATTQTFLKSGDNRSVVVGARLQGRLEFGNFVASGRAVAGATQDGKTAALSVDFSDLGTYDDLQIHAALGYKLPLGIEAGVAFGIGIPVFEGRLRILEKHPKTIAIFVSRRLSYGKGHGYVMALVGRHDPIGSERYDKLLIDVQLPTTIDKTYIVVTAGLKPIPGGNLGFAPFALPGVAYRW